MNFREKQKTYRKQWLLYAAIAIAIVLLLYWLFAGTLIEEDTDMPMNMEYVPLSD